MRRRQVWGARKRREQKGPAVASRPLITADAGYHSEANLRTLVARRRPALIADRGVRRRDARFATQARHHPLSVRRLRIGLDDEQVPTRPQRCGQVLEQRFLFRHEAERVGHQHTGEPASWKWL